MIDTHAHLDDKKFYEDRGEVIRRAFDAGVEKIINVGADLEGSRRSVALAEKYAQIFASVGLHPHEFNSEKINLEEALVGLEELAKNKKVVAIGEIGLDYFSHTENPITKEQKENQKKGFIAQLKIARELKLPVIVHCRDAYEDIFETIKNYSDLKFVLHCYGGGKEMTKKFMDLENSFFSVAGNITYAKPGAEILEVVKRLPLEKLLAETDCPYLAPLPHRGKRNEPAYLRYVIEKIAEIKEISAVKIAESTENNAEEVFAKLR